MDRLKADGTVIHRSRWWFAGVGLVGLAAAALIGTALLIERPPFQFLRGHNRLPLRSDIDVVGIDRDSYSVYSFRADPDDLLRRAKEELLPLGYHVDAQSSPAGWVMLSGPSSAGGYVMVSRDRRIREASLHTYQMPGGSDKGWVTVYCEIPQPSLWDRLKMVVGL